MGKIPVWAWVLLGVLALYVAQQRGLFAPVSLSKGDPAKNPPPVPAAGTSATDIINNAVSGIFGLARQLVGAETTPKTT